MNTAVAEPTTTERPIRPPAPNASGAWWSSVDSVIAAALCVLAVAPFRTLFVSSKVVFLAAGIVALCLGVNLVLRRVLAALTAVISVLAAAVYLVVVVFKVGLSGGRDLGSVWGGVSGSWADLLTATVPAGTTPELAALPVLIAWLAAELSIASSVRTRSATAPIVPPIVAFGVALLFTGGQGLQSPAVVGAVIALSLLVVLIRSNTLSVNRTAGDRVSLGFGLDQSRRSRPSAQLQLGVGIVVVVTVAAALLGPRLPLSKESKRIDLHDRYDPKLDIADALSPLSALRASLNSTTDTALFSVQFSGIPAGTSIDRVRTAVLDIYDGTVWGTDAKFALAGNELPKGEPDAATTVAVHQTYTLNGSYSSSFLPALGRPTSAQGNKLGFDRDSGMLIAGDAVRKGVTYDVDSAVPVIPATAAKGALAGNNPSFARLSLPPPGGWPAPITAFAAAHSAGADRYDKLVTLQEELRSTEFGYTSKARPGHSLAVLTDFLTASTGSAELSTARVGYAEQFAAAFAVVARVEGMPSRVVVGYKIDPTAASAGKLIDVRPRDIHAWAEVHFNGVGWLSFDPTDTTERDAVAPPPSPATTIAPAEAGAGSTLPPITVPPLKSTNTPGKKHGDGIPLALVVGPLLIAVVPASLVLAKFLLRRSRRRRGEPARRALAAWFEARDRLRAHGVPVGRAATVAETAELSGSALAPTLYSLVPIIDAALYAPGEPGEDLVEAAWIAEAEIGRTVAEGASVGHRARALVDPRPLVDAVRRRRS